VNTYELLLILKPFVDSDDNEAPVKILEKLVKGVSGKVTRTEKIGRKRLAYEINGFKDGYQLTAMIEIKPEEMTTFRTQVKLTEEILRMTTLKLNKVSLKVLSQPRPPREFREREQRPPMRGRA